MKALFGDVPEYWLNFGLHTVLVSLLAVVACLLARDAGRRAFVAAVGVGAIAVLPWVTAGGWLSRTAVAKAPEVTAVNAWEGWRVRVVVDGPFSPVPVEEEGGAEVGSGVRFDWRKGVPLVWVVPAGLGLAVIGLRQARLWRRMKSLRELSDREWRAVRNEVEVPRNRFRVTDERVSPWAAGFFRQRIVVPEFLFAADGGRKLGWALRHEAEHLRAGDPRVAVLLSVCRAVLWWNPAVGWLGAVWAEQREMVCDDRAARESGGREEYGGFLVEMAERLAFPEGALSMAAGKPAARLRRRIAALLRGRRVKRESKVFRMASVIGMLAAGSLVSFSGVRKSEAVEFRTTEAEEKALVQEKLPEQVESRTEPPEEDRREKGRGPFQVKIESMFLVTSEPIQETGRVISEEEKQLLLRRLAAEQGNVLTTAPSVAARSRQDARVEIIWTNPEWKGDDYFAANAFVGLVLNLKSEIRENVIESSMDCRWNYPPGKMMGLSMPGGWEKPSRDFDWKTVKSATAKTVSRFSSGQTVVVAFEGAEGGKHLTGLFRVTRLDATGRPLDREGRVIDSALNLQEGRPVRVRGAIVTPPESGRLPSYLFSALEAFDDYWYPSGDWSPMRGEAEETEGKGAWVELGSGLISSGKPSVPWEKFPVRIGVKTSDTKSCQVSLVGPGKSTEWRVKGYIGYIMRMPIDPAEDGRRRWLLLALDEAE